MGNSVDPGNVLSLVDSCDAPTEAVTAITTPTESAITTAFRAQGLCLTTMQQSTPGRERGMVEAADLFSPE